jgi:hypothetical protein
MKTINRILLILTIALFSACQGEEGPMGPPGEDGTNILGSVYEIKGSFGPSNNYSLYYKFPKKLVDGDVVIVYILWKQESDNQGGLIDVWRPLPQTILLNEGIFQYNFDYTMSDVQIVLEGDLSILTPGDTANQIFRIAVIPADMIVAKSVDINNFNAVMKAIQISPDKIQNISTESPTIVK